jgi:hypothetical protein
MVMNASAPVALNQLVQRGPALLPIVGLRVLDK